MLHWETLGVCITVVPYNPLPTHKMTQQQQFPKVQYQPSMWIVDYNKEPQMLTQPSNSTSAWAWDAPEQVSSMKATPCNPHGPNNPSVSTTQHPHISCVHRPMGQICFDQKVETHTTFRQMVLILRLISVTWYLVHSKNILSAFKSLYMSCHESRHSKELFENSVQVVNYTPRLGLETLSWPSITFLWITVP